jgi:hypothetical protein
MAIEIVSFPMKKAWWCSIAFCMITRGYSPIIILLVWSQKKSWTLGPGKGHYWRPQSPPSAWQSSSAHECRRHEHPKIINPSKVGCDTPKRSKLRKAIYKKIHVHFLEKSWKLLWKPSKAHIGFSSDHANCFQAALVHWWLEEMAPVVFSKKIGYI